MADEIAVVGIAASSQRGAVTVERVIVRRSDESIIVEPLEAWQGTAGDEVRSIHDLVDSLSNVLDHKRTGAPVALAVKRTESPRGRPASSYDQKIRVEGAAMVAAASQGRRYFGYRTSQLGDGRGLEADASAHSRYPESKLAQDAVAAACAALTELLNEG